MVSVTPKKRLGQHFLKDHNIAQNIAASLTFHGNYRIMLEVGPGTGILTRQLLDIQDKELWAIELDRESVSHLRTEFPVLDKRLIEGDFLKFVPGDYFSENFAVIGNFPYNISSQILFRILDWRDRVPEVAGMFQKEVAQRIASPPGNKQYGILSVLLRAYYDIEYLFSVPPHVFHPPPKVDSAVLRLKRNAVADLGCDHGVFKQVVRTGFNQRRKTLRNALKMLGMPEDSGNTNLLDKRAEQLDVEDFVLLTKMLETHRKS
jgi:16S rRNA (adenine1518-N6/adenine1519-N6)-dimethyltransferase